ncbi:MAG: ATP-binding protein [Opitutaceae bacterium]
MKPLRFKDLSITTKLRSMIVAAVFVAVAATSAVYVVFETHGFRRNAAVAEIVRAKILAVNSTAALAFSSPKDAMEILGALKTDPHVVNAAIYDGAGRPFAVYSREPTSKFAGFRAVDRGTYRFGPNSIEVWVPIELGGKSIGTLAIRRNLDDLAARLRGFAFLALAVTGVAAFAAFLLAGTMQRAVSRPVLALASAAARVTEERDYSVRVESVARDEIGRLTEAFNAMLATIESSRTANEQLYEEVRRHAGDLELRVKERTAQLESANEELESFSSSVSHDLRGPVRYMSGYAEALLEDHGKALPPEARGYVQRIVAQAEQMDALINALLEISRSSQRALAPERLDLGALCRATFEELKKESAGAKARVAIEALPPCRADPVLARQVAANLLSNAIKYSRNRSEPRIRVGSRSLPGEIGPVYFVQDNGVGFDMAHAGRLFTAFQRLHTEKEFEGTGVGLATVKRIVQRHGGRIWAEAAPDVGATFFFTLPAA